jgi:sporulation protein YlmC with PRC-barrel domain
MSSELRLKKLRGSGGFVMARVTDEQQSKGNLGGPDLFLAPIGRLESDKISKYSCNTCENEFEGSPNIEFENPNEEVAENLILVERGKYICNECNSTIAEYREFKKSDEQIEVGLANPIEQNQDSTFSDFSSLTELNPDSTIQEKITSQVNPVDSTFRSIMGMDVFDENAKKIGVAKQVGVDSTQSLVLVISDNEGNDVSVNWDKIGTVGEVIFLGKNNANAQIAKTEVGLGARCSSCNFDNKSDSKFCEMCGTNL